MLTDAHFHALDLERIDPSWLDAYRGLGVIGVASCHSSEEWEHADGLRRGGLPLLVSFGVHPQLPVPDEEARIAELASSGGIDAVGECGFDLFDAAYAATEREQSARFSAMAGIALANGLPLVVHARKAMDRIFRASKELSRARSVVFHSWPGSAAEGKALLARGVNAFFSLGASALAGRRRSVDSLRGLPADRILAETDAPYQPPPRSFRAPGSPPHSRPADLPSVIAALAALRDVAPGEFESTSEEAFMAAYGPGALAARRGL